MSYTPNNIYVFTSAYAGAVGGLLGFGKTPTNPDEEIYALACETAGAFAQAVDGLWSGTPDWLDTQILQSLCQSEWLGKNVPSSVLPVSAFASAAAGIVAILEASEVYFDSEGIEPPAIPGEATIEITLTGDVTGTGPADDVVTQAIQLQSFAGPSTPPENGSWTITNWYISPATGNDANSGTSVDSPLKTKQELARRWGTWSPVLQVAVTITYLPGDDSDDPGIFTPIFLGGSLTHFAPLPDAGFVGTLSAVTAKSASTNQPLQSTFNTTSGSVEAGMLLVNLTRGDSRAFAVRDAGGGNWILTQPNEPYIPGNSPLPIVVDTWSNGDTIQGYMLAPVNLVQIGGIVANDDGAFTSSHYVYQLAVWDPIDKATDIIKVDSGAFPVFVESMILRSLAQNGSGFLALYTNCWIQGGAVNIASASQIEGFGGDAFTDILSGFFATTFQGAIQGVEIGYDIVIGTTSDSVNSYTDIIIDGGVYLDNPDGESVMNLQGLCVMTTHGAQIYGNQPVNITEGILYYPDTATYQFPTNGGLQLSGVPTGYSRSTTAGVTTIHGGIALTPANLVAAAGAAGFGGTATNLAGAAITNGTQT